MSNKTTMKPLSAEEKKEAINRQIGQEYKSMIQGVIFNAVRGIGAGLTAEVGAQIIDAAVAMGDHYIHTMYTPVTDEE